MAANSSQLNSFPKMLDRPWQCSFSSPDPGFLRPHSFPGGIFRAKTLPRPKTCHFGGHSCLQSDVAECETTNFLGTMLAHPRLTTFGLPGNAPLSCRETCPSALGGTTSTPGNPARPAHSAICPRGNHQFKSLHQLSNFGKLIVQLFWFKIIAWKILLPNRLLILSK